MKTPKYIIIALALGICSANAIIIHHDTLRKFDLTLDSREAGRYAGINSVFFDAEPHYEAFFSILNMVMISPAMPDFIDGGWGLGSDLGQFYITWRDGDDISFDIPISIVGGANEAKVKIANDLSSIRFTWHFDQKPVVPVPDAGSTFMLLGMALSVLGLHRRRPTSQQP